MRAPRMQPPAASRIDAGALLHGLIAIARPGHYSRVLEDSLRSWLGVAHVWPVSSGKSALTIALQALGRLSPGRTQVIIPAYTCFSVPSAIVRAGLDVVPCDIDESTLDFDYRQLSALVGRHTLCVISCHLFGAPADVGRAIALCAAHGAYVVEDAAQALGIEANGRRLGTRGDVGIFSVGRGKAVDAGGGGIIVANSPAVAQEIDRGWESLPSPQLLEELKRLAMAVAQTVLIRPWLFWLPASIPQLRIGATVFDETFPVNRMSSVATGMLRNWKARLAGDAACRTRLSQFYAESLSMPPSHAPVPYLRYPVLLPSRQQKEAFAASPDCRKLGLSPMYPSDVSEIPQLRRCVEGRSFPRAASVASRLMTAPTHFLIARTDAVRIREMLEQAVRQALPSESACTTG